jgi:HEAT repeat protein
VQWLLARSLVQVWLLAAPPEPQRNAQHSDVQDIVDAIVRGEGGVNVQLARARSMGKEAEVAKALEETSIRVSDRERLRNIALALVALMHAGGECTLMRMSQSSDPGTRMYAVQGLGQLKSKAAVPKMITLVGDKVPAVRREAARAVGAMRIETAAPGLLDAAKAETELEAKAAQIIAIGQVGGKKQVKALEKFLTDDPSESTRRAAARALCTLGEKSGLEYAKKMLSSDDQQDHLDAVKLFEDAKAEVAAPVLEPLLNSRNVRMAAAAAHMLYTGGNTKMLEWLVLRAARSKEIDDRLIYEHELESIGITDKQRHEINARNGIQ